MRKNSSARLNCFAFAHLHWIHDFFIIYYFDNFDRIPTLSVLECENAPYLVFYIHKFRKQRMFCMYIGAVCLHIGFVFFVGIHFRCAYCLWFHIWKKDPFSTRHWKGDTPEGELKVTLALLFCHRLLTSLPSASFNLTETCEMDRWKVCQKCYFFGYQFSSFHNYFGSMTTTVATREKKILH